jgi:uncharacterized protein YqjF (DUF2071 family)
VSPSNSNAAASLWPAAPPLPRPVLSDQVWADAVFVHWRIERAVAARYMPPGVEPDEFDGSAWVGLIGFQMRRAGLGKNLPLPYFGNFAEINVRLYSREPDGTRGVVFRSLEAPRLAFVAGARLAGIPYVWARCRRTKTAGSLESGASGTSFGYESERFRGGATTSFSVLPELGSTAADDLSLHLTSRFGLHAEILDRTRYLPNTHSPWPLHPATVTTLDDGLVAAAGIHVEGPPESVLYSPGVRTFFGKPRTLAAP